MGRLYIIETSRHITVQEADALRLALVQQLDHYKPEVDEVVVMSDATLKVVEYDESV